MENSNKCMITTFDNPYSPFDDFVNWLQFDNLHDYGTCELLARYSFGSDSLSDSENDEFNEAAIDEIIKSDPRKIYLKVFEADYRPKSE